LAVLLAVTLLVGLLLPLEQFGLPSIWGGRVPVGPATPQQVGDDDRRRPSRHQPDARDDLTAEWGLFTAEFVRDRLRALEEELGRLDRDPDVFAKAFHTIVARSAYEALRVEATTLPEKPWWRVGEVVDTEVIFSSAGPREVLEF
jgi:hypothetical protein